MNDPQVVSIIRDFSSRTHKCLLVFGPARSGTSAVALALKSLGINMGRSDTPYHEDVDLVHCDKSRLDEFFLRRAGQKKTWGFKVPSLLYDLPKVQPYLVNPCIIAVSRNPTEIAFSAVNRGGDSFEAALLEASRYYMHLYETIICRWPHAACVVDYGKLMRSPRVFVKELHQFVCGSSLGDEQADRVVNAFYNDSGYSLNTEDRAKHSLGPDHRDHSTGISGFSSRLSVTELGERISAINANTLEYIVKLLQLERDLDKILQIPEGDEPHSEPASVLAHLENLHSPLERRTRSVRAMRDCLNRVNRKIRRAKRMSK